MSSICRSSPFRSTWNTGYITGLDMCQEFTEAVHSVALGTRVTLQVWTMRPVCTEAVHSVALGTRVIHYRFGHVSSMYRSSPFRSTWNTGYITGLDMRPVCTEAVHSVALGTRVIHYRFGHVSSIYRSSPFRSTWNTGYITGLDMCQVYTEAVHSVALGTRVTLQVWTCVQYVPKQSIP